MPYSRLFTYLFSVAVAIVLSACATTTSIDTDGQDVEEVNTAEKLDTRPIEETSDPLSDLMYEVLAGELAGKLGDLETSKQFYSRAARLTDDPDVIERAMRIAIFAKDWPLALEVAHRWSDVQNNNLEAQQVLGVLYLRQGDLDSSAKYFAKVMEAAEDSPSKGYSIIASTLVRVDEVEKSLELMERLVAIHFDNPYGHLSYANLAMQARKFRLAVDQSELALGFKPDLTEARILRARALSALGDHDSAFLEMKGLVDADPDNFDLRLGYARMLLQSNRFKDAGVQLERLLTQRPNDPDLLYTLGLTYVQTESYTKAKTYFQALVDSNHRLDEAYYYLARINEELGDEAEAVENYKSVAFGELYLDSAIRLADLYVELEGLEFARNHLNEIRGSISNPEEIIRLFLAEGHLLHEQGLYQDAYDLYSQGLREFPRHPDLLYARALTADYFDRLDLLEADLLDILQSDPDNANALNALGYTLADRGLRIDEAQKYVERAFALKPDDPAVIDSMGWIHFRLGNYAEAESYLRRALDLMDDAEIVGHLGELLWAQGNYEEARSLLREAMERHPEDNYIQKLIKQFSE